MQSTVTNANVMPEVMPEECEENHVFPSSLKQHDAQNALEDVQLQPSFSLASTFKVCVPKLTSSGPLPEPPPPVLDQRSLPISRPDGLLFPIYASARSNAIMRDKARATDLKAKAQRPCRLCGLETWRVDQTKVFSIPVFSTPDNQVPNESAKVIIDLPTVPGWSSCPLPSICKDSSVQAMEQSCQEAGLGSFAHPSSVVMCALCYVKFDAPTVKAKFESWFTSPCAFKWDHPTPLPRENTVILSAVGRALPDQKGKLLSSSRATNSMLLLSTTEKTKTGSKVAK